MSEWMPISSAPTTQTILVWHKQYGAATAHVLVCDIWGAHTPGVPMLFQKHLTPTPTHWMPLPAPPQEPTK